MELVPHPRWTTLKIYPQITELEKEIGLLNDIVDAFNNEAIIATVKVVSRFKEFINERLNNSNCVGTILIVYSETENTDLADIFIGPKTENYFKVIAFGDKYLHFNKFTYTIFIKHFWYYLEEHTFNYNNLVCLAMIVKDAGPGFKEILEQNLPFFDRWCILDTGSTDGTQNVILETLALKKGKLYEEPFINFRDSRNRCLELAGKSCKFIVTLDDTYVLKGDLTKFLNEVRGDTFADSFSLLISSNDSEYFSNRIIKSEKDLRYKFTIHEVIDENNNVNVTIPPSEAFIFDHRSDYMENRTMTRKQLDLELLFKELEDNPSDPRTVYYIGQTYGCTGDEISKAIFFEKRIKLEGYVQERVDALFELARCYNFKINCETMEYYDPGDVLTETQWKRCEELYTEAYNLDPSRPDSLYFIGIHYYLKQNYEVAFYHFKLAFELGYPINSQYSLKPTLSYHFLPRFLTEVCYHLEENLLGLKAAELFLNKNNPGDDSWNLVMNWYKIHQNLLKVPKNPKLFVIVTDGGWEPWTGRDIETKGLGGSETWIIETAKILQEDFTVVVFCRTEKPEVYNGVGYNPIELFHGFVATTEIEYLVVSRFTEYIPVALKGKCKNVSVIFHDILLPQTIIPVHPKLKSLIGLTKWHSEQIKKMFPQFNVKYNHYGVNLIEQTESLKIKNSFIYSSFPNRGLVILLKMWSKIKEILPDATLSVYCNLEQQWVNEVAPEMMKTIKETINQQGVTNYGWVSKPVLNEAWAKAEYWLYPCIFEETFCLTALEAAISKTCVITNGLAGLAETAKHAITVDGNPLTEEWQIRCLEKLKYIVNSNNLRNDILIKNYNFASSMDWKSQTEKLIKILI